MSIKDRPTAPPVRLLDLLRGVDSDRLLPLVIKISDAALDEDFTPVGLQAAAMAAAALLVVQLTRPERLPRRQREAEQLFSRLLRAHADRMAELGDLLPRSQREMQSGLRETFRAAWRAAVDSPIPARFVEAGCKTPEDYRETLMASDLQRELLEAFTRAGFDHSANWPTLTIATIVAAGVVCGSSYQVSKDQDAMGFVEDCATEFRNVLERTISYWRQQKAH